MKHARRLLPLVALLSATVLISDAEAQSGGIGGIFGGSRGSRGGRGSDTQGSNRETRNERTVAGPDTNSYELIEYRLSLFQEDLKLKPEQNDAWQSFARMTRAYAGDIARERARGMRATTGSTATANALQHVGEAVDAAQNRLTALQDVESSTKTLYQTLTSEQKALADIRIPTIIAPRPAIAAGGSAGSNLPDLGSGSRQSR